MAIEQKWPAVPPQLFMVDGGQFGVIKVANAAGFRVKQSVVIAGLALPELQLQVKRVIGPDTIIVGPLFVKQGQDSLSARENVSAYTVALSSYIYAAEQDKSKLKPDDIWQAIWRQEPGTTIGVEIDDRFGNPIDSVLGIDGRNRLAVDAAVTVSGISVDIDALTPPTRPDPDNILIVGSEDGTKGGLKRPVRITPQGELFVKDTSGKLVSVAYNDVEVTVENGNGDPTTIVYSLGGSPVATMAISYFPNGNFQKATVT